jgi:exodeoxyribonuclease-5
MNLTQDQSAAIDAVLDASDFAVLSGAAGTGKTTIISALVDAIDTPVAVCTPTNKAAQVLQSKGIPAATFFKRFYYPEEILDRHGNPAVRFIPCKDAIASGLVKPENLGDKLTFSDTIIVDEASMVTARMAREMKRMCNRLILVGDRNQLPPVNDPDNPAGYFCTKNPDYELTQVLRQGAGSPILELASAIRTKSPKAEALLRGFEPEAHFTEWAKGGGTCISFTNKERQRINTAVRKILGFTSPLPQPGDRVIGTSNYSDTFLNGTPAIVLGFEWDGSSSLAEARLDLGDVTTNLLVAMKPFLLDQPTHIQERYRIPDMPQELAASMTFGYCLTAHKAQGSEWPEVAVFDQRTTIRKMAANNDGLPADEFVRRWLYTAVTRAREGLVFAPPWWAQSYTMGAAA